jgi:hypothetical protein
MSGGAQAGWRLPSIRFARAHRVRSIGNGKKASRAADLRADDARKRTALAAIRCASSAARLSSLSSHAETAPPATWMPQLPPTAQRMVCGAPMERRR